MAVAAVAVGTAALLGAAPAGASPARATGDERSQAPNAAGLAEYARSLNDYWARNGVDAETRASLVQRIRSGQPTDSIKPGEEPVASSMKKVDKVEVTTYTYEDGSISMGYVQVEEGVVDMEVLGLDVDGAASSPSDGSIGIRSISGCTVSGGSGYSVRSNCMVAGTKDENKFQMWFFATYTIADGAYNDSISWTGNPGKTCIWPYSCGTLPVRSQLVTKETAWSTAGATYTMPYDQWFGDGTAYLNLVVGNNTSSWPLGYLTETGR
ncbi:hypothetical protein [Georgenia yuyongxinii]